MASRLIHRLQSFLRKEDSLEHGHKNALSVSSTPKKIDVVRIDAELSGWFKQETGELLEGFPILSEDIVLDAGCGDSPFAHFCAMQCADIILNDVDAKMVSIMVERLKGSRARSVTALVSDACTLPVKDASVSKIIAMEIMEHVDDPGDLLKELIRVGRPGAQYLITAPDPIAETVQKDLLPPGYFEKPNHVRVIGRQEFEQLVTNAGLVLEQHKYYGFYWSI